MPRTAPQTGAQPTKPELAVLKFLWKRKAATAREITDAVAPAFEWTYSTMRTVLERMCEKGLLTKRQDDGVNAYGAAVGKVALLSTMIRDFSDRVLELDAAPPAVTFADSRLLSVEELEELELVLREENEK